VAKIGAKVIARGRYAIFQMAEVAVPRELFGRILDRIARLRPPDPAHADARSWHPGLRPECLLRVPQSGRKALGDVRTSVAASRQCSPPPSGLARTRLPSWSGGRYPGSEAGMGPVHPGNVD